MSRLHTVRRHLTRAEVMFLYSTAYGAAFTRGLVAYHTSGPSELMLVATPNAVQSQHARKLMLRRVAGANDRLRSLLHMPDSLGDTYANIACLFGEATLAELIRRCYSYASDSSLAT